QRAVGGCGSDGGEGGYRRDWAYNQTGPRGGSRVIAGRAEPPARSRHRLANRCRVTIPRVTEIEIAAASLNAIRSAVRRCSRPALVEGCGDSRDGLAALFRSSRAGGAFDRRADSTVGAAT